jgi:hypothetical protein
MALKKTNQQPLGANAMDLFAFLVQIAIGAVVSAAAIVSLNSRLSAVLTEICGTRERANFWARYTNVMLFLSPLLGVVLFTNSMYSQQIDFLLFKSAFKSALFGLFVALVVIGFQFVRFTRNAMDHSNESERGA